MFCPRCASENESHLSYCRRCGQALTDVRLALEHKATEALEKLRDGRKFTNGGVATITAFILIAVLITILGIAIGDPSLSTIAVINVVLGAIIGVPLILVGQARVRRATRLLSESNTQPRDRALSDQRQAELPTGSALAAPGSVTENTTLDLKDAAPSDRELKT
jgi:hypothetical protein